ncbi:MAG: hypothetical protein MUE85_24675 [Microscillaceae bacterium]|jgi:hypothetical protein|nr:hypothetical protein [Microscillaceae bacterium]
MLKYFDIARLLPINGNSAFVIIVLFTLLWIPLFLFCLVLWGMAWLAFDAPAAGQFVFPALMIVLMSLLPLIISFVVIRAWWAYLQNEFKQSVYWMVYSFLGIGLLLLGLRLGQAWGVI